MKQPTLTEISAVAADLKNHDQHIGGIEVEAPVRVEAPDESSVERAEAIDRTYAFWQLRDLRACAGIVLGFQAIYLAADWTESRREAILLLHMFNILNAVVFLGLTHLRAYRDRIPQLILVGCTLLFAATAALSIITLNREPLTITVTIMLVGVAALVPWDWRWQAGLSITGAGSMAASMMLWAGADPHLGYDWLAIVAAAGVAHYAAPSGERYRREIESRIMAFRVNHRQLRAEVAAREGAIQRLGQSEAKLRKIFETSNDAITINRLSDGRYLEVNEAFGMTGYSREEALAGSAGTLGVWAERAQLREFMKTLAAKGSVVNMEFNHCAKGGRITPYLISAKVIDLEGEKCVVTIGRDILSIKQTEADLLAAREFMRAQIETLARTEERLRAEILEHTRAMEQRETALRRMADSESKLRKIFATSNEMITISRQIDGHYLEVNEAFFLASGYTREEALNQSAANLGIWPNRAQLKELLARLKADRQLRTSRRTCGARAGWCVPTWSRLQLST